MGKLKLAARKNKKVELEEYLDHTPGASEEEVNTIVEEEETSPQLVLCFAIAQVYSWMNVHLRSLEDFGWPTVKIQEIYPSEQTTQN